MKHEKYLEELQKIKDAAATKTKQLHIKYASSKNPYRIGDFVTDHIGTIKIENINVYVDLHGFPSCRYHGTQYTKSGAPFKSGEKRSVYQINLVKEK